MRTTVNLSQDVRLRLEQLAARQGVSLGSLINELVGEALAHRREAFESHAAGDADVDDLGVNAEKYLAEDLADR
jgi:hypothetical protein